MPMATLQYFRSQVVSEADFARNYEWDVIFLNPPVQYAGGDTREVSVRCESVIIPGQNIETSGDNIRIGPIRDHAFGVNYGSINCVFLASQDLAEKTFFEDWQREIFSNDFKMKYYDDYVADIMITQYNKDGKGYRVKVFDAFPKTVNQVDLNQTPGEFLRVSVELEYHHWRVQ